MIMTLTLNPCVDRTVFVHEFDQTPDTIEDMSGGKGINVARVLGKLGCGCVAIAPCGGRTGARFAELARREGVNLVDIPISGETRIVETTVKRATYEQRVAFGKGPAFTDEEINAIRASVLERLNGCVVLAICGSSPCHAGAVLARDLILAARAMGVKTLLDSSGETLKLCIDAAPDVIKPNEKELAELLGVDFEADNLPDAMPLFEKGVGRVLLSLGEKGCAQLMPGQIDFCPAPKVHTINAVGSGDCFVAGWLHAQLISGDDRFALAEGCAAGAANAAMFPAAMIGRPDIEALLGYQLTEAGGLPL